MSCDFGTVGSRLIEWLSSTLLIMNMVEMNICFHLFQVNTWEMYSWTMEGVLFLTAYKKLPVSKAVCQFTFHFPSAMYESSIVPNSAFSDTANHLLF